MKRVTKNQIVSEQDPTEGLNEIPKMISTITIHNVFYNEKSNAKN